MSGDAKAHYKRKDRGSHEESGSGADVLIDRPEIYDEPGGEGPSVPIPDDELVESARSKAAKRRARYDGGQFRS